jgi:hypothetical protein
VVVPLPRRVVPLFKYSRELKQQFEIVLKQKAQDQPSAMAVGV